MSQGWIKLHRKITESTIFGNEKGLKVWIWCLVKAGHEPTELLIGRNNIQLSPGEFVTGLFSAAEELRMARTTILYWLEHLQKQGQVELKKTSKYTIVKVKNWEEYQEVERKRNADGKQTETNNNVKNDKNIFIYLDDQKFSTAFVDYLEMRQKIKKPATEKAKEMILKKLHEYSVEDAIKMLEQSIINSWQGIFPLKEQNKNQNKNSDGVVTCHDGTQAVLYFGRWVDANNKNTAMDLHYYPELAKL